MQNRYPHFNRRHADVMKWLLEHPAATLTDCAAALGYSRTWLSRIVNAPEFRTQHKKLLEIGLQDAVRKMMADGD